jgi:hypothetical protein
VVLMASERQRMSAFPVVLEKETLPGLKISIH